MHHISNAVNRGGVRWARARRGWGRLVVLLGLIYCCVGVMSASAVNWEQLTENPQLTPEWLLRQFADFEFRLGQGVQSPRDFLTSRAGDCDDFATYAAEVLRRRGYTTRLVVVHLEKAVHVVCYVNEVGGYLDYNRRREVHPVVVCDNHLHSIARMVAASLLAPWRTASEFVYENGRPKYLETVFQ
jgi:hypothetical protein